MILDICWNNRMLPDQQLISSYLCKKMGYLVVRQWNPNRHSSNCASEVVCDSHCQSNNWPFYAPQRTPTLLSSRSSFPSPLSSIFPNSLLSHLLSWPQLLSYFYPSSSFIHLLLHQRDSKGCVILSCNMQKIFLYSGSILSFYSLSWRDVSEVKRNILKNVLLLFLTLKIDFLFWIIMKWMFFMSEL